MNDEEMKLLDMLRDNKISESDYQLLMAALNKQSFCMRIESSWLINPFQKVAGFKALLLGLLLLVIMSLLGAYAGAYFDGVLGILLIDLKGIKPHFLLLLYQNVAAWLTLSLFFIAASQCLKLKGIRFIDFFGTTALARFPIIFPLLFALISQEPNQDSTKDIELHLTILGSLGNLFFMASLAWLLMTYLFAFKESSGATGKDLWIGYTIAMVLGEITAMILTRWFLYV